MRPLLGTKQEKNRCGRYVAKNQDKNKDMCSSRNNQSMAMSYIRVAGAYMYDISNGSTERGVRRTCRTVIAHCEFTPVPTHLTFVDMFIIATCHLSTTVVKISD